MRYSLDFSEVFSAGLLLALSPSSETLILIKRMVSDDAKAIQQPLYWPCAT